MKMSCHCCIIVMFDVNDMTLESVNDSVLCLTYIFNVGPFIFQAINVIVALACVLFGHVVFLGLSSLMCDQMCPISPETRAPSLPWSCWPLFPVLVEWPWQGWLSGWMGICQRAMLSSLIPPWWIVGCPPSGRWIYLQLGLYHWPGTQVEWLWEGSHGCSALPGRWLVNLTREAGIPLVGWSSHRQSC